MLKIPATGLALPTIADLRKWIRDVAGWEQTGEPGSATGRTTLLFRDSACGRNISIIVEPIDRFVIYHLIDMGN